MKYTGFCLSLSTILKLDSNLLKEQLKKFVENKPLNKRWYNSEAQEKAWVSCFEFLKTTLKEFHFKDLKLIFEYSMPDTIHKRPDIVILLKTKLIVLEFKTTPKKTDTDQLLEYRNLFNNTHKETIERNLEVIPFLVYTDKINQNYNNGIFKILTRENFSETLKEIILQDNDNFYQKWLESDYYENPNFLKMIENMYKKNKIPNTFYYNEICLENVNEIIKRSKRYNTKNLIFISGVPGSGKTSIGLNIVFNHIENGKAQACYFSGNKNLITYLQSEIRSIIKKHNSLSSDNSGSFIKDFSVIKNKEEKIDNKSILVFDEAQRAWIENYKKNSTSDPQLLLNLGDEIAKKHGYVVIIVLYGTGQAIGKGEDFTIDVWKKAIYEKAAYEEALHKKNAWTFNISAEFTNDFRDNQSLNINFSNDLYLSNSLRTIQDNWNDWINHIFSASNKLNIDKLKELTKYLNVYITRDKSIEEKTKYQKLTTIDNNKNGYLNIYQCQGIEYENTIVKFAGDLFIQMDNTGGFYWCFKNIMYLNNEIILNRYRVLFSRVRKKMIIYIPMDNNLNNTFNFFNTIGVKELQLDKK